MSDMSRTQEWMVARAGAPARAVVCAGGMDIPYVRAGRGDALVLLASDIDGDGARQQIESLSARFMVIAAAPPPHALLPADITNWLRGFLEGLGITRTNVLVDESLSHLITGDMTDV